MLLKLLREGLGRLFILGDVVSRPKPIERTEEAQNAVDLSVKKLSLYQFYACPFCMKVRRHIHKLNLPIELRDAQNNTAYRQELESQGGAIKVPCLRIEEESGVKWMYESNDIIQYLDEQYANV